MTIFTRAAMIAVFSAGIVGLSGMSTPTIAAQAATDTIVGDFGAEQSLLPAPRVLLNVPTVAAVAATAREAAEDDAPTALDAADDQVAFPSLAAAVAGQTTPGDPSAELRCLAGAIYYEAKGEPLSGQLAVAEVVINRARSGRFPKSLCGVVTQAGQFGFVRGGVIPAINPATGQWKTALAVAQVALGQAWESPASAAMYFHARYVSPGWAKPRLASIGNHVFYR